MILVIAKEQSKATGTVAIHQEIILTITRPFTASFADLF